MTSVTPVTTNRLLNPFGPDQTGLLERQIRGRVPFYVRMQVSSYEARAGYLLHELANGNRKEVVPYHCFFCSSTGEALSGALKLVRHNHYLRKPDVRSTTAVYDPTGSLCETFDPLSRGVDEALVPGLMFLTSLQAFQDYVEQHQPFSLLIRHPDDLAPQTLSEILRHARSRDVYTILDESSTDLSRGGPVAAQLDVMPDLITFGENLTDHRAPAGCFLMAKPVYRVWDNVKDYSLHSNTWGGNSISLATMLTFLESTPAYRGLPASVSQTLRESADSHRARTRLYAAHCSPTMATMLNISGLNKNIRSAHKARIETTTRRGEESVIDASGTYGVNLQGHNPEEVIDAVVTCHDTSHDYWRDLQELMERKTGLSRVLPAVSGATAVEGALAMALLAAAPKKKVLVMQGGFGGKTLISLMATARDRFRLPFGPLYPHVSYISPFDQQGEQELLRQLATGDVAVVILETIQGEGGVRPCPQRFLDLLVEQKKQHDFLIVVDEVQTGMYRTGKFLNYQGKLAEVDIVTMAKGMSDNVFPVAATLMSERVFQQAQRTSASAVDRLANQYRCQFGAQVAIHAIESGEQHGLAEHAETAGAYFRKRLKEATTDLDFVKDIRGEGLMVGLEFEPSKLPRLIRGSFGGLIASRCVNDPAQPVLLAFSPDKPMLIRFLPPLCITTSEIDAIVDTMSRAMRSGLFGLLKPIVTNTLNSKLGRI